MTTSTRTHTFFLLCSALFLLAELVNLSGCGQVVGADCREGLMLCGDTCCPTSMSCQNDTCVWPTDSGTTDGGPLLCPTDEMLCDGVCTDILGDPDHCGACGAACASGERCSLGECTGDPCPEGWMECGGTCVDPESDAANCGACGAVCATPFACHGGICDIPACDIGESRCGELCVDIFSDEDHCGACGNVCDSGEICAGGRCELVCPPTYIECEGRCIDPSANPDHCGTCGNVCESGRCTPRGCVDATSGHIVVIGHDYYDSVSGMNRVVGSATFLALEDPLRIIGFEGSSEVTSVDGVRDAIEQVATATGRDYRYQRTNALQLPSRLAGADALVIYSQHATDDTQLRTWGLLWRLALRRFLHAGGVIVLLDGGGENDGTWQILESAGLIAVSSSSPVPEGSVLEVRDPADAVARDVPLTYAAEQRTVRFETTETGIVVAERDAPQGSVVLHRVVLP